MAIPLTIFSLYRLDGDACSHHLLLRVHQPGYSNADARDEDYALQVAEAKRHALIRRYEAQMLARECPVPHAAHLVGELQARPAGEALSDAHGGRDVDVWIAQTPHGAPWVVLGTAEDEAAFWRAVREDDDLARLGPMEPAVRQRAYFLADDAE